MYGWQIYIEIRWNEDFMGVFKCNANQEIFEIRYTPIKGKEHKIDTGSHTPISNPPYRISPAMKERLKLITENWTPHMGDLWTLNQSIGNFYEDKL